MREKGMGGSTRISARKIEVSKRALSVIRQAAGASDVKQGAEKILQRWPSASHIKGLLTRTP